MTYRPFEHEKQWRHRAEELRTIGENSANETVRDTYYRLAEDYERLADRAAIAACTEPGPRLLADERAPTSLYRLAQDPPRLLQ